MSDDSRPLVLDPGDGETITVDAAKAPLLRHLLELPAPALELFVTWLERDSADPTGKRWIFGKAGRREWATLLATNAAVRTWWDANGKDWYARRPRAPRKPRRRPATTE